MIRPPPISTFFFFNDTAPTEIYTLSLHDALPISRNPDKPPSCCRKASRRQRAQDIPGSPDGRSRCPDRKSTRLNSSHLGISYAVFCLKKKKNYTHRRIYTESALMHIASAITPPIS